jgi:hypothetical protein
MTPYDIEVGRDAHFLPLDYWLRARTIFSAAVKGESFIKIANVWFSAKRCSCDGECPCCLIQGSGRTEDHRVSTSSFAVMNTIS